MCAPRSSSVFASATNFTKPVVSPIDRARPLAEKGNLPVRYSRPLSLTCRSVSPTTAISGQVYTTPGIDL